jgi:hypothetical protein
MSKHVVVDGSNLATEGRSLPSLKQLSEAVEAYMSEHPTYVITVVVDATFGHRIDASELKEFDAAVENNEIVSPPAGAIGRGDAFVLTIANKANAIILSNDSFQEFHPDYPWLFDEGRLVGGKPVPHVGWVFVARSPVRGIVSRRATKAKKSKDRGPVKAAAQKPSALALEPMPVPKMPPPRKAGPAKVATSDSPAPRTSDRATKDSSRTAAKTEPSKPAHGEAAKAAPNAPMVNELMPFLSFVENFPVGSLVDATVDSYSSHGAYATCADGVRLYIPMRSMANPAPRSAREVLSLGQSRSFVVVSFNAARRGIDAGVPGVVAVEIIEPVKARSKKAAPAKAAPAKAAPAKAAPAKPKAAPAKPTAKAATAAPAKAAPAKSTAKAATAKGRSSKKAAAPAKKASAPFAPLTTAVPVKAAVKKAAAPKPSAVSKKAAAAAPPATPKPAAPKKAAPTKAAAAAPPATPKPAAPKKAAPTKARAPKKAREPAATAPASVANAPRASKSATKASKSARR